MPRLIKEKIKKICEICDAPFEVIWQREHTAKYCSTKCAFQAKIAAPNVKCTFCGTDFHMKEYRQKRYGRTMGYFCSRGCMAKHRSASLIGENNPNFRNVKFDSDGYCVAVMTEGPFQGKAMKVHKAVTLATLDLHKIARGFHIHHRDCNLNNNSPENLVILTISDHKWIHKQYGSATLYAYCVGLVDLETVVSWSNDLSRARRILQLNLLNQNLNEIGVVKDGELLENPEADNQQPSLGRNSFEGPETSGRTLVAKPQVVMPPRAPST